MPSIYDLKPRFQALLRPWVRMLAGAGVTANQVTIFATALSLGAGAAIAVWRDATWPLFLVPLILFARMALNAVDGMLAREHHQKTSLGAILNEIGDVISDAGLYLPFALIPGLPPAWIVAVVVLSIISEMAGVVAVQIGASRRYDGPMGKSDRAFVFGALALLVGFKVSLHGWICYALMAVAALLVLTVFNRARAALREVRP
jgi:CDP-diacylglycerol--glycerol-3-phosphate 3-phosphatidyltransferase